MMNKLGALEKWHETELERWRSEYDSFAGKDMRRYRADWLIAKTKIQCHEEAIEKIKEVANYND